jgi:hypothetical protein
MSFKFKDPFVLMYEPYTSPELVLGVYRTVFKDRPGTCNGVLRFMKCRFTLLQSVQQVNYFINLLQPYCKEEIHLNDPDFDSFNTHYDFIIKFEWL